jgi:quercetin dioxygenase-like cupin family protein
MTNRNRKSDGRVPTAEALNVAGLVEYVDGAVVSRTVAENSAGTLTLFAFDEAQGLSEHTTPYDAIVQILDGEAVLTIGDETVCAEAGQLVVMPANVPHAVKAEQRFKMLLIMLRAE